MIRSLAVLAIAFAVCQFTANRGDAQFSSPTSQNAGQDKQPIEKFLKSFSEPRHVNRSKPVEVNDARFEAVAQSAWKPPQPNEYAQTVAPIEVQLWITNLQKTEIAFSSFKTFGVRVLTADGKEVKSRTIGNATNATGPIVIPAGGTFALCRRAELSWDEKNKSSELRYCDGTGQEAIIGPLKTGSYKLVFWYSVPSDKQKKKKAADSSWAGEAITKEVPVEVLGEFARESEIPRGVLMPSTEPIRLWQSKPVIVNDAKFVFVGQTNWKLPKGYPKGYMDVPSEKEGKLILAAKTKWLEAKVVKPMPIELQLHITNVGKKDLIFPTFDALHVGLFEPDGKQMLKRGGRNHTILSRPIALSAGESYVLGVNPGPPTTPYRWAELHYDDSGKNLEFAFSDGTGWISYFGPLRTGLHKLRFGYLVSPQGPFNTARDAGTWMGDVIPEDLVFEVSTP